MLCGISRMRIQCCIDGKLFSSLPPLTNISLPSPKEIHLWYVIPNEVKGESLMNKYMEILSPCEIEKVLSFQRDELRKSALLARALVRTTIARYQINSSVKPKTIKFRNNIHGKPEVDWLCSYNWEPPSLHFNISHTSSLIACGVTVNSPIGVDVEEKERTTKHSILTLARRYFSKYELEVLTAIEDPYIQQQEFVKLWTLKEAYVKALGKGFSGAPFKTFTIRRGSAVGEQFYLSQNSSAEACDIIVDYLDNTENLTSNWQFMLLELASSHYIAICRENDVKTKGDWNNPMKLTAWKTIPLVEDRCVSETDKVLTVCGLR
ncbi:4'-phosphopantetheinyl transferase HetI [Capsicum galapagoense]